MHALILLLCTFTQDLGATELRVLPSTGKNVGMVLTKSDGRWLVLNTDLSPTPAETFKLSSGGSIVFWEGNPGTSYGVIFIPVDILSGIAAEKVVLGSLAPRPPPVIDPEVDPTPSTGIISAIILRDAETLTTEQAEVILNISDWVDSQDESKYQRFHFDPKAVPQYAAEANGTYPFLLIVQESSEGKATIRWKGVLPTDSETAIKEIQKW